ncbi:MAG: beta-lactamase family protein [Pyrinomonadaceae bacterium]|nr:beta-lactamase family protein [Pyrinomonadaceae bacterium]
MKRYSDEKQFQGAVLIAEDGKVIYKGAFGLANMEWKALNSVTTRFRIASVTKPFTALLVLQAVEQGFLKLDGKVTDYLPDYPKATGERVTIHHLLSHTSGLVDYPDIPGFEWNRERLFHTQEAMLKEFSELDVKFTPGTDYRYSNFGYYLLGVMLEKVTGKKYATLLQEKIFDPAGMKHTSVADNKTILDQRAAGYFLSESGYRIAPPFDTSIVMAAGDIISTVDDLYLWDQALYTNKLLSAEYRALLFKPTMPEKDNYAYGWYVRLPGKHDGPNWARHSGTINGFSSIVVRLLDDKRTIILLSNVHGIKTIPISDALKKILYSGR